MVDTEVSCHLGVLRTRDSPNSRKFLHLSDTEYNIEITDTGIYDVSPNMTVECWRSLSVDYTDEQSVFPAPVDACVILFGVSGIF